MTDDGERAVLDELRSLARLGTRREPGAERPTRQHEHERAAEDEHDAGALEPPARFGRPTRRAESDHEDRGDQNELDYDPTAAPSPESRNVSQG